MDNGMGEAGGTSEKELRWHAAEAAMSHLRENPIEWESYQAEAELGDATSADGLDDLPYGFTSGTE